MNFAGEFREIGRMDVEALTEAVMALPEEAWFQDTGRQQVYKAHARTHTIPLIFDPDMRHADVTTHDMFHHFKPLLQPALDTIEAYYKAHPQQGVTEGEAAAPYFARIILVRLPAGAFIGSHRDHGQSLSRAHRIHLPIVTHPKALFAIAGVIRHLEAGTLVEINNRKPHAVKNESDQARIHFIFDYVLPGEVVQDELGVLVA